jgi:hypothetical protein
MTKTEILQGRGYHDRVVRLIIFPAAGRSPAFDNLASLLSLPELDPDPVLAQRDDLHAPVVSLDRGPAGAGS